MDTSVQIKNLMETEWEKKEWKLVCTVYNCVHDLMETEWEKKGMETCLHSLPLCTWFVQG